MNRQPSRRWSGTGAGFALAAIVSLVGHGSARAGDQVKFDYATQARPAMAALTHSGASVGTIVSELRRRPTDAGRRSLVQPFLAPMSRVLVNAPLGPDPGRTWHDLQSELAAADGDTAVARPAWRDLLDEGRYRVCYDADGVRLFAPGWDALAAWRGSWPLLRFPVRFLRDSGRSRCATIELFAYENDYAGLCHHVVKRPHTMDAGAIDADPEGLAPLNLSSLDDFMRTGTAPLAVEVDDRARLFLYGRQGQSGTLAGSGMTLADLAVAYRAVFWCGDGEPYVSLDQHEDNRFVKVNFGGLLADTRIGQVALDADRYFKTISTGLDPIDRRDISDRVRLQVADFIPGSVRDLPDDSVGGATYRFWFYPDSLRVETDGSVGVVASPRFLADIERRDNAYVVSRGHRRSIDDLNRRYDAYSKAVPVYAELDNVGRVLALMTWLREVQAGERVDLAALLSVDLPAWRTERAIRKSLVVNCYTGPVGLLDVRNPGFLPRTRIFDFSDSLAQCVPTATDDQLLEYGSRFFNDLPKATYADAAERDAGVDLDTLASQIARRESELEDLARDIESTVVDGSSRRSIDAYNAKVGRYRLAMEAYNDQVAVYNQLVARLNEAEVSTHMFVSVGGGIDLSVWRAPIVRKAAAGPVVREVLAIRPAFVDAGGVQAVGGWIRSRP